jgi:hypothetical protein
MPSVIKRKTSHVQQSGFQIYAGDEPRPGGYRGILKNVNLVKSKGDNLMFTAVVEFQAKDGSDKKQYDGYATFPMIPLTDAESNVQREQALYLAVCGKKDADTKTDVDPSKFKAGDGQKAKVLSIGGVNPEGKVVNVRMRNEVDNRPESNGAMQLKCDLIFAVRGEEPEAADEDIEDDETDEEGLPLYEEDDLKTKNLVALRKILVDELGQDAAEMKAEKSKAALIELILELQEDEDEDDDEEDEDEEDEQDEDEDEEEDEEDDKEAEIRSEVEGMDRVSLKAAIKKRDPEFKVLKSTTDEALREALVALMLQDPPF